ncbi:MAG: dephospho-CoA kinase [Thermodesulfovibrionales bacterium]
MPVIGLTGNYGMGKSTVAGLFREAGAVTLDLDDIVDELLNEDDVIARIIEILGDSVLSGKKLNRPKIAEIIFTEREKRELLEGLLHPLVIGRMKDFLKKMDKDKVIIIEIPLLFERQYEGEFDKTITVYTDKDIALKRLESKGIKREDALMRLQAQMPIEEKIKRSDFSINNNGTIDETRQQVLDILEKIRLC